MFGMVKTLLRLSRTLIKTNPRFARAQQMAEREFGRKAVSYTVHEVGRQGPRPSTFQKLMQYLSPTLDAQTYDADDGSGYVVFSTYYDDYSSYWEGNTYSQSYDGAVWETINNGIYTETNTVAWTGDSDGTAEIYARSESRWPDLFAFFFPTLQAASPCECAPAQWAECSLRNALSESWNWCAGAASGCAIRATLYWECVGVGCAGRFAGAFIGQLWMIRNGCG